MNSNGLKLLNGSHLLGYYEGLAHLIQDPYKGQLLYEDT